MYYHLTHTSDSAKIALMRHSHVSNLLTFSIIWDSKFLYNDVSDFFLNRIKKIIIHKSFYSSVLHLTASRVFKPYVVCTIAFYLELPLLDIHPPILVFDQGLKYSAQVLWSPPIFCSMSLYVLLSNVGLCEANRDKKCSLDRLLVKFYHKLFI